MEELTIGRFLRMKQGAKSTDIRARAEAKIAGIEQKIRALEGMKKALPRLTERCDGCSPPGGVTDS